MTNTWLPANHYPGLTVDRLIIVGDHVRTVRTDALKDHRPEKHETNWSLGVRGYERTCGALTELAQTYPWLTIVAGAGGGPVHFVMSIGGHPIRFYQGHPHDVPQRYQQPSLFEQLEQQRALVLDADLPTGRSLRLVIENAPNGAPKDIYLAEMDDETKETLVYRIPDAAGGSVVSFVAVAVAAPATMPAVTAELVEQDETTNTGKTGSDD